MTRTSITPLFRRQLPRGEAGFTLAELAFSCVIFVIIATVLVNHLTINYTTTASERDRVFAYTKAQSILSEVQAFVDRGQVDAAVDLDMLDDGSTHNPVLTVMTMPDGSAMAPDSAVSENFRGIGSQWVWSRRISVRPFTGLRNRNVRYVTVSIFKRDLKSVPQTVAEMSAVINSTGDGYPATQVFDVYLVAIENIPGWWVYMDSIRPFVESTITDLEARNPGFKVRTHWITKSSFGRNPIYRPYFNEAADSWQPIPQVYFYPGRMPSGSASAYYYVPANVRGRIQVDGSEQHGYESDLNPHPYALADYFNHAMRYPDELALWQARVAAIEQRESEIAAAIDAETPPPPELDDMSKEPTLRLFLEDLNTSPARYTNALIVNLHGELLPAPPLRNFSDPARSPVLHPEVRVVTHPEELRTRRDAVVTDDVKFRVYGFTSHSATYAASGAPEVLPDPIAVEVMGVNLLASGSSDHLDPAVLLQCLRGGVTVDGTRDYFPFTAAKHLDDGPSTDEMCYTAAFIDVPGEEKFTRILLYNTPVVAPPNADDGDPTLVRGLFDNERSQLYQMAYVPCSCDLDGTQDFSRDLYADGDGPKNTARWRFSVPASFLADGRFVNSAGSSYVPPGDLVLQVRTRIWAGSDPATTGVAWPTPNDPDNLSKTWAWWTDSPSDVPITERSQFLGDPRHCPYRDLLDGDADFANGYNWFLDSLQNDSENSAADYDGLDGSRLRNRWRNCIGSDVGRIMEVWRKGLVGSACVYTTLTGFSNYYVGIGNEVGYDANNGYPNSIPVDFTPLGMPGLQSYLNTINSGRKVVRDGRSPYWFGIPWLGELYPDWAYASHWMALDGDGMPNGNLEAGSSSSTFYQAGINSTYSGSNRSAWGTALNNQLQRTGAEGCTSFFNIGDTESTFHHQSSSGTGTLTAAGTEIIDNYNIVVPTTASISRPFGIAIGTGSVGDEFGATPYSTQRFSAQLLAELYSHPGGNVGSGMIRLTDAGNTSSGFIVVNGIDSTTSTGTTFIGKWAVLSLLHSYFSAGEASVGHRIKMPPRVEIVAPNDTTEFTDPDQIALTAAVSWRRWDDLPYRPTGTYGESEAELVYVLSYSNDGGKTWRYVQDDSVATPGVRPTNGLYLTADAGPGNETWVWDVPEAQFPAGSYLLHVDCYRVGSEVHYACHTTRFYLDR
jgi:hypothetical protein